MIFHSCGATSVSSVWKSQLSQAPKLLSDRMRPWSESVSADRMPVPALGLLFPCSICHSYGGDQKRFTFSKTWSCLQPVKPTTALLNLWRSGAESRRGGGCGGFIPFVPFWKSCTRKLVLLCSSPRITHCQRRLTSGRIRLDVIRLD